MEPDYVTVVVQVPIITLVNSLNLKLRHNNIDQPSCPGDALPEECSKTHTVYKAVPCSKGVCIRVRYGSIDRIVQVTAVDLKRYANVNGFEGEFDAKFSIDSFNRTLPKPIVSLNLGSDNKLVAVNVAGPTVVNLLIVFSLENIIQNANIRAIFKNDFFGWDKLEAAYSSKKIQGVEEVKSPPILHIGLLVGFALLLLLILQ